MSGKLRIDINELNKELAKRNIKCLSLKYTKTKNKHEWLCLKCGHHWESIYNNVINKKYGCPKCATRRTFIQFSINDLNIKLQKRNIRFISSEYLGVEQKYSWLCLICNHIWIATYSQIVNNGHGCPKCGQKRTGDKLRNKITIEQLNKKLKKRNIKCLSPKYVGSQEKYEWLCLVCNNQWQATYSGVVNYNHGCRKCAYNNISGENHYLWNGGSKKGYPPEWTESKRESIRNRDNRKCQFLDGCDYDDTKEKIKLHVHHIDGNKKNCEDYNLVSLCQKHHRRVENNPKFFMNYFYEYTSSFKY